MQGGGNSLAIQNSLHLSLMELPAQLGDRPVVTHSDRGCDGVGRDLWGCRGWVLMGFKVGGLENVS